MTLQMEGDQVSSSSTCSHYDMDGLNIHQKCECQVSASAKPPKPAHSPLHLCAQIQPASEGDKEPGRALHVQRHGRLNPPKLSNLQIQGTNCAGQQPEQKPG